MSGKPQGIAMNASILRVNDDVSYLRISFSSSESLRGFAIYPVVDNRGGLGAQKGTIYRLRPRLWQAHPLPMAPKSERDADPSTRQISNFFTLQDASEYLLDLRGREPHFDALRAREQEAIERERARDREFEAGL